MKVTRYIVALLGVLGFGAGTSPNVIIPPASAQELSEAEACEEALAVNTIEALERFLRKYPDSETACTALAQFGPSGGQGSAGDGGGGYGG